LGFVGLSFKNKSSKTLTSAKLPSPATAAKPQKHDKQNLKSWQCAGHHSPRFTDSLSVFKIFKGFLGIDMDHT